MPPLQEACSLKPPPGSLKTQQLVEQMLMNGFESGLEPLLITFPQLPELPPQWECPGDAVPWGLTHSTHHCINLCRPQRTEHSNETQQ